MRKKIFIALMAMVIIFTMTSSLCAQETDPAKVVIAMADALNASDVETTMALFTDDASTKASYGDALPPDSTIGKEQVRLSMEYMAANNFKIEIEILLVLEDIVVTRSKTWIDETIQLGIAPLEYIEIYPIQDGKIKGFMSIATDETVAKIKDALAPK